LEIGDRRLVNLDATTVSSRWCRLRQQAGGRQPT
jgi:hypothetical protein